MVKKSKILKTTYVLHFSSNLGKYKKKTVILDELY